jgi:uncharacterized protein DUF1707/2TM domain-containing protein
MSTLATTAPTLIGDRDRATAARLLGIALTEGYLDIGEYDRRVAQAYAAENAADLAPLLHDLPVAHLRRCDPRRRSARRRAARMSVRIHTFAYLAMVAIVLTVWLAVALSADAWYFWPVWPIMGAGIGLVAHSLSVRAAHRLSVRGALKARR